MKLNKKKLVVAISSAFAMTAGAYGAVEEERILSSVVTTATRTEKLATEAPASVTVVTEDEIRNKNAVQVEDALKGAAGVVIRSQPGSRPSNYENAINLRGIPGYYRTGILVDGIAINNAFSGGANMSAVPVDDIKQIEVVPGPFSSLYGGSAMAGVVNIITKEPTKTEYSAKAGIGPDNFSSTNVGFKTKVNEALGVSFSYANLSSDGYVSDYVTKSTTTTSASTGTASGWSKTSTSSGATSYIVGDKGKSGWKQENYGLKTYVNFDPKTRLIFDISYLDHSTMPGVGHNYLVNTATGAPLTGVATIDGKKYSVNATDFMTTTNGETLTRYSTRFEKQFENDVLLKATLGYQLNEYWYTSATSSVSNTNGAGTISKIPNDMLNGDIQFGFPVLSNHYVIAGASANQSDLRKKVYTLNNWQDKSTQGTVGDWANGRSSLTAYYVQDEISVSDKLTVYAGLRKDSWSTSGQIHVGSTDRTYDERSKSATSPKISAVYKATERDTFRVATGNSFRAPNLSDMYSTWGTSTIYWANPDLDPELARTSEIGFDHYFSKDTIGRATYYRSDVTNLIYSKTVGSNNYKYNAGKAQVRGIDLELRSNLMPGLAGFVNYTFVQSKITENDVNAASVGNQIPYMPSRMANAGFDINHGKWSGSLITSYVGKMYASDTNGDAVNNVPGSYDPYVVVSAKATYQLDKNLNASIAINNLFDREYYYGASKAQGQSVYFWIGYKY